MSDAVNEWDHLEEMALGYLNMTENQLWAMTPRTFHNLLKGRMQKEKTEREQNYIMHRELVVSVLSPHMKKPDRDKAYKEIEKLASEIIGKQNPAEKKKKNPVEFWNKIDKQQITINKQQTTNN